MKYFEMMKFMKMNMVMKMIKSWNPRNPLGCSLKNINVNIFYDENDDKMDEVDEYDDEMVIPRIPVIIVFWVAVFFVEGNKTHNLLWEG